MHQDTQATGSLMLSKKKEHFSDIFYVRHRNHVAYVVVKLLILLAVSGAASCLGWYSVLRGNGGDGSVLLTAVATAVALWLAWVGYLSVPNILRVRLLPYFDGRVDGAETWLSGESLLWNTRALDDAAVEAGVKPLSSFASGDDLVPFEQVRWFSSEDGLRTAECLIDADSAASLSTEALSDLVKLRDALRIASAKGVKFCLLLREGSFASGLEMDRRSGTFF